MPWFAHLQIWAVDDPCVWQREVVCHVCDGLELGVPTTGGAKLDWSVSVISCRHEAWERYPPLCSDPILDAIGAGSSECEFLHQPLEQLLVDSLDCGESIARKLEEERNSISLISMFSKHSSTSVLSGDSSCCNTFPIHVFFAHWTCN
jgi:hypothetical protein